MVWRQVAPFRDVLRANLESQRFLSLRNRAREDH